jgi:hypothetical protein
VAGAVGADSVRRQLRRRGLGLRTTGAAGQQVVIPAGKVDADVVVRGPVAALELDGTLDQAEQLLALQDPSAADLFAGIATKLEEARYGPHAAIMRRREADALQNAGRQDDAVIRRVVLAWDHLDAVQPGEAGFALNDGRRPGVSEQLNVVADRVRKAADASVWAAKGSGLDDLIAAFDALEEGDPYRERAAAFLCEQGIADVQPAIVLDRRDVLEAIARAASGHGNDSAQRCGARIQMCVADVTVNGLCFCRSFIAGMPDPSWRGLTRVMAGTLPCVMAGTLPCRVTALALRSNTCWLSSVPARRTCSTRPPMALRPAHGAVLVHRLRAG